MTSIQSETAGGALAGPLSGIVIADLTRVLAGPYCTMVLRDLGARVIKIETPDGGDDAREIGPFIDGKSAYFMSLNRGKESIALNLKDPKDRETFEAILTKSDILVENYRAGTMEKLGYGWDDLHPKYPQLIYAAASGFGHTGPYKSKPAYDMVVQAMGGIMSLTGHPGGPPTRVGSSIGDITAGLFTTTGITSALYHRAQTGEAIKVDVGMLDSQVAILENAIARYVSTGEVPGPIGARHPSIAPFEAYQTHDDFIIVAAGNNSLFEKFAQAIDAPHLSTKSQYATNDLRCKNVDALRENIEAVLKLKSAADWLSILEAAGVPCGPINTVDKILNDPHIDARNMVVSADDKDVGKVKMAGNPIKLSGFVDPPTRKAAPDLDEDRKRILDSLDL